MLVVPPQRIQSLIPDRSSHASRHLSYHPQLFDGDLPPGWADRAQSAENPPENRQ